MIYCIWYPSGGFGHFINAVLTLYGHDFVRPKNSLKFSTNGNSHRLDLIVPKYCKEHWPGNVDFLHDKNYCVLIDNGINNESDQFKLVFPDAFVIKICYSDSSWPIVAKTMIDKAMQTSIDQALPLSNWSHTESWARREKYFLFLRDHQLRHAWKPTSDSTLLIDNLLIYESMFEHLNAFTTVDNFECLWTQWRCANSTYIDPVKTAQTVIDAVIQHKPFDFSSITDLWTQAVIYYYIWIKFGIEVPHNDFENFFASTDQIEQLVS